MRALLKKYFFAGLIVWLPIWATFLVVKFIIELFDSNLALLPHQWQPDMWLGFHLPGLGLLFSLFLILFMGFLASNFLGRRLLTASDSMFARIPLLRSIYSASKQVIETLASKQSQSFRKVYLLQYPRVGTWTFAFQTADIGPQLSRHLGTDAFQIVYVPTTPNPTSGFMLIVPSSELIEVSLSVDEALRFVISLGTIQPAMLTKK